MVTHTFRAAFVAAALASFAAHGQTGSTGGGSTSGATHQQQTTDPGKPPGADQATGNKGAVPASGASGAMQTNPATGSTPGTTPGERSPQGNKAATPKSDSGPSGSKY
jgi:hypothetical protein